MSTLFLTAFAILFVIAMFYAVRLSSLAVALGVATYGLKQIGTISVPYFALHPPVVNFLIAGMILASLGYALLTRRLVFETKTALDVTLLVWAYLAFFWTSTLWSPVLEPAIIWRALPYFVVYVLILPFLVGPPPQMVKGFRILWGLLMTGLVGTLLSPMFVFSLIVGRAVVVAAGDDVAGGANPLAFADTAALLALISIMLACRGFARNGQNRVVYGSWMLLLSAGVFVGVWSAFISSRGETVACLVCGVILVVLITSPSLRSAARVGGAALVLFAALSLFALGRYGKIISAFSPRFTESGLSEAVSIRGGLQAGCLRVGTSSPRSTVFGVGAGGCQDLVGLFPHSELLEALAETGILGLILLSACYLFAIRFGLRTLALARRAASPDAVAITAFALALLFYEILMANKKGSLYYPDSYMWVLLSVMIFDRARAYMRTDLGVTTHG